MKMILGHISTLFRKSKVEFASSNYKSVLESLFKTYILVNPLTFSQKTWQFAVHSTVTMVTSVKNMEWQTVSMTYLMCRRTAGLGYSGGGSREGNEGAPPPPPPPPASKYL
jgi:hypothetical protein